MNNTKFFELMGDINDKYFAENYEEPLRAERVEIKSTQKRGAKRWIIPVSIAAAACLAIGIAAPQIADMIRGRNAIDPPANSTGGVNSATAKALQDWLALPHHAVNSADNSAIFSSALTENGYAVVTFENDTASDIYAVDDCTVTYVSYANAPYLGKIVAVDFGNGLWGMYRNSYKYDDSHGTEISVKDGDKLKAGDRIGKMYPSGFKLIIGSGDMPTEQFVPKYPELDKWEAGHSTLPVAYHNPYSKDPAPETLTENLGYRGFHSRFYFIDENEPAYAVSDGTVYAVNDYVDDYDNEITAKSVVIKLSTDFETPLYAIYYYLDDDLSIKVGDTVKEGDVIGKAFAHPAGAPVGMFFTVSTTPYVPEVDEDGNFVSPDLFKDWIAAPHNAINSTEKNVTLKSEPVEGFKERALMTIEGTELTDIYAIADCTVTRVGYANAPYLGKTVDVDFGNGIWGIYRSSYKYDDSSEVEFAVKEGDTLKAGDKIGTMYADGFKLAVGKGYNWDILSKEYVLISKWKSMSEIDVIQKDGVKCQKDENIGYYPQYSENYVIDSSTPAYIIGTPHFGDGKVFEISDVYNRAKKVVIELDKNVMGQTMYMTYNALAADSVTLKVGDTVKEGDVIGDAFASPDGGPVTFTYTISMSPEISELDDDGNPIS